MIVLLLFAAGSVGSSAAANAGGSDWSQARAYTYNDADQPQTRQIGAGSPVSLTVDDDGNITNDGTTTWTYNAENLPKASSTGGTPTSYVIDGEGNRVSPSVSEFVHQFLVVTPSQLDG